MRLLVAGAQFRQSLVVVRCLGFDEAIEIVGILFAHHRWTRGYRGGIVALNPLD
jgi:hypothetical protein